VALITAVSALACQGRLPFRADYTRRPSDFHEPRLLGGVGRVAAGAMRVDASGGGRGANARSAICVRRERVRAHCRCAAYLLAFQAAAHLMC
jgi:hypothetical protein